MNLNDFIIRRNGSDSFFFSQEYFVICQFVADLNLITKVQFFVYILKRGLCEIPNSNPFCQLKIYMPCNGLSTFAPTMAFVIIFEVYVDWIDWKLRNFGEIVGNFWVCVVDWGSEFRIFKACGFSIGTNQQTSIDKRLFDAALQQTIFIDSEIDSIQEWRIPRMVNICN